MSLVNSIIFQMDDRPFLPQSLATSFSDDLGIHGRGETLDRVKKPFLPPDGHGTAKTQASYCIINKLGFALVVNPYRFLT